MKEFILFLVAIALWIVIWRFLARAWRRAGRSPWLSHFCAAGIGLIVAGFFFGFTQPDSDPRKHPTTGTSSATVVASATHEVPAPTAASGSTSAASTVASTDWPAVAMITLPQPIEEKQYLAHRSCIEGAEGGCDGSKRFARFIHRKYPDIARVRYEPDPVDADDPDMVKLRKEQFVHGLYFAKQIRLANGQNLYDFIRSCSNGFMALDAAESAYDDKVQQPYFDLRYFVTLRRIDNGQPVELQLLFERRGDKVIAGSPFFSSNALRAPDFLQLHHVACWPKSTNDA